MYLFNQKISHQGPSMVGEISVEETAPWDIPSQHLNPPSNRTQAVSQMWMYFNLDHSGRTRKNIQRNNIVERFFFHLQPSVKQLWCQLTALPHTGQAVESTLCNYVTATLEAKCHNHFVLRTTRKADNGLGYGDLNRLLWQGLLCSLNTLATSELYYAWSSESRVGSRRHWICALARKDGLWSCG